MKKLRCPPQSARTAALVLACLLSAGLGCNGQPAAEPAPPEAAPSTVPVAAPPPMDDNHAEPATTLPAPEPAVPTPAQPAPAASQPVASPPVASTPAASPPAAAKPAAAKPAAATDSAPPPRHEPLFVGWPKPSVALFVTGQQHGYIEPCGCSGLTNQKGGLVRRYTCQQQLLKQGWDLVALDVGNQVRRFGRQPEIMFQITAEGLEKMHYRAIGFGPDDLRLSAGELIAITADEGSTGTPFVCANAAIIDRGLTPRFHVIEAGGKKIGVTAVLGADELTKVTSDEILEQPPESALREVWAELAKQNCDLHVLLAHTSLEESARLAQAVPHFQVVVTAGGAGEPTFEAEKIAGTESLMVQVGTKGMYVGVVGVFADPNQPFRYQRVPLDDRFPDAPEMLQLLASYQDQLKAAGLEGLGVKPIPYPTDRQFVGSDACEECHDGDYAIWEKTGHGHALDSLVHPGERSEVPRHFDPECISCHVVGWNSQKHFPYVSGYLGLDETPLMHNVGCESCHGPGSAHVTAENGDDKPSQEQIDQYRAEVRLRLEDAEKKCQECHDYDNSPDFHAEGAFETYWKKVEHGKKVEGSAKKSP